MALEEARLVEVDVAADDAVEVTEANDEAEDDTALVYTLDVVGDPGNRQGHGGVDAQCTEEGSDVLHDGGGGGGHHDEAGGADDGAGHVEDASFLDAVGPETDNNGSDGGDGIGRHTEQLVLDDGVLLGEMHVGDDGGQEQTEGVERHERTSVDQHADIGLPVLERSPDRIGLEVLIVGGSLLITSKAVQDTSTILGGQEFGFGGEVVDHPEGKGGDDDGDETLEDEDPPPALEAGNAVHVLNGGCQQATK